MMFEVQQRPLIWYNSTVKMILATVAVLSTCASANAVEATLHSCPPPDTEFETNIVAETWSELDRVLEVRLEFTASPSNNVQIAFGVDEDGDGILSFEESECAFGWDCGAWFVSGYGSRIAENAISQVGRKSFSWKARLDSSGHLCELAATDGSIPVLTNLPANGPAWLWRRSWNMVRFTARGAVDPDGGVDIAIKPNAFRFMVR